MPNALYTGVTGLVAHQRLLDVTANNIANVNTVSYKSERMLFDDLIYETLRPATSASSDDIGGVNPNQVGSGVKMGQIDRRFTGGPLELTGEQFDFAVQGEGFFVASDGNRQLYTRAGAFTLDANGYLIDATTGYYVQRFGEFGEPDGVSPAFQVEGDNRIRIPLGAAVPGAQTTEILLEGNLSSSLNPDTAEELMTRNSFRDAAGNPAVAGTLLNNLQTNSIDYVTGDIVRITLKNPDGSSPPTPVEVNVDGTTTLGDLLTAINANLTGATATIDNGKIKITSATVGPATLALGFNDIVASGSSKTDWALHTGTITKNGQLADTIVKTFDVYDVQGNARRITLTLTKETTNEWSGEVSIQPEDGAVLDGTIAQIRFDSSGKFQSFGDNSISLVFAGMDAPQAIDLSFTDASGIGLTHLGSDTSLVPAQDGFGPGALTSVLVNPDGTLTGVGSNGTALKLAQLALAGFTNSRGLKAIGDNMYEATLNSGAAQIGAAASSGRGAVLNSQLEGSNVDLALEFTRLVVAQRGFSANARTITIADQMLEELTNVIR
ncbi:MAG: flagellar hook-basal body complex protein [Planctomycetota bacterium]|nr:flagellar hook-basal body complex protein [Planctomycetota bacterium]